LAIADCGLKIHGLPIGHCRLTDSRLAIGLGIGDLGIGDLERQSAIGNRQSAIGNRVDNPQSESTIRQSVDRQSPIFNP
jgi:hypothetical protein